MHKMQKYDFITAGFIYILSIAFIVDSFNIKQPDSRILPRAWAIFLIIFATGLIIQRLRKKDKDPYDFSGSSIAIVLIIMMIFYAGLSYFIGMYITTPIFLFLAMYYLGMKNKIALIVISLGMDLFIFLAFGMVFKMPIPMGVLFG